MYTVASEHIMAVARIHKEVGLGSGINAGTEETDAVLGDTSGVVGTDDHFQASFQVSGSQLQVGVLVASGLVCGVSM